MFNGKLQGRALKVSTMSDWHPKFEKSNLQHGEIMAWAIISLAQQRDSCAGFWNGLNWIQVLRKNWPRLKGAAPFCAWQSIIKELIKNASFIITNFMDTLYIKKIRVLSGAI